MDYEEIEQEIERYELILNIIDEKSLMWHFNVRNLRKAKKDLLEAEKSGDKRAYQDCLRVYRFHLVYMKAPLCLASAIEDWIAYSEDEGYSILEVTLDERQNDMILKGRTGNGEYCEFFHDRDNREIAIYIEGEYREGYPMSLPLAETKSRFESLTDKVSGLFRKS